MLFSLVKISSFRVKAHLLFNWSLYNKYVYSLSFFVLLKTEGCPILSTRLQSYSFALPNQRSSGEKSYKVEVIHWTRLDSSGEVHFLFMPRRAIMLSFNLVIVIVVFYLAHCEITFFYTTT